jgi:catechol 2,3-dioxygenase-like lactoylglutathione lyase family enzyme
VEPEQVHPHQHQEEPVFASIRIITEDVDRLTAFYERVTGQTAVRPAPVFAQLTGPGGTLAIASPATVAMLGDAVTPAANRSVIVEFEVDDVDAELTRLDPEPRDVVLAPSTMPWGNRSALLRDPDGNLVNLFSRPPA